MEKWLPVVGFEGLYEVSSAGAVRALHRRVAVREHPTQKARAFPARSVKARYQRGYQYVSISKGGKLFRVSVHRIVLAAFKPTPGSHALDGNHINGVRDDNRIENLEWCSRGENIEHSYRRLGRQNATSGKFGAAHHRAFAVRGTAPDGSSVNFDSLMCAQRAGYSAGHISACLSGKRQRHKGMQWSPA